MLRVFLDVAKITKEIKEIISKKTTSCCDKKSIPEIVDFAKSVQFGRINTIPTEFIVLLRDLYSDV
jgi:hypothetical protein